jgi:hypothetical protein
MRKLVRAMLLPALLGGCATGYAKDWFRDRPSIINPQLLRFGLDVEQSRCVSDKLGKRLSRQELRRLQERAAAVRAPAQLAAPLNLANLRAVAGNMGSREISLEVDAAIAACNVSSPARYAGSASPATGASGSAPLMSGGVPVDLARRTSSPAATWLNLGAAESGQSIAIDAASIEQAGEARTAWFRMTDPNSGGPSTNHYRLRIDCAAKSVQPLALRQLNPAGGQVSTRDYTPEEAKAEPAEAGTVLEIAYLSLCT